MVMTTSLSQSRERRAARTIAVFRGLFNRAASVQQTDPVAIAFARVRRFMLGRRRSAADPAGAAAVLTVCLRDLVQLSLKTKYSPDAIAVICCWQPLESTRTFAVPQLPACAKIKSTIESISLDSLCRRRYSSMSWVVGAVPITRSTTSNRGIPRTPTKPRSTRFSVLIQP